MICLDLFLGFLRVGCFAFGGAYGAIPLIREVVLSYGWLSEETLAHMIAISESTPGPIMVNLATYVGSSQAGLPGAALATLAVILPSFVIILLIMAAMKNLLKNPYVQAALRGIKPCVIGVVLATGVYMTVNGLLRVSGSAKEAAQALLITGVLAVLMFFPAPLMRLGLIKKKVSPIALIGIAAVLGALVYAL